LSKPLPLAAIFLAIGAAPSLAQRCPDVRSAQDRHTAALRLADCLGDPDPKLRDALAFEGLSAVMRSGALEQRTLSALKSDLLARIARPDLSAILASFSALTLSEVARTDRIKAWMTDTERQELVDAAARFLSGVKDFRAFSNEGGYVHAVAHGADFVMQLALNPAIGKAQLDRLLVAVASQVVPSDPAVAYWAGEPDRLARAVVVIAQRNQHSELEWRLWFEKVSGTQPHANWLNAFKSEAGIRQLHNMRAFLLSVLASATSSDDPAVKQLAAPTRDSLRKIG
jgi:hypothetical protein